MQFIRNKTLLNLNARGWLCISLTCLNLVIAFILANAGSMLCFLSLAISFFMWLGIYDSRNNKQ